MDLGADPFGDPDWTHERVAITAQLWVSLYRVRPAVYGNESLAYQAVNLGYARLGLPGFPPSHTDVEPELVGALLRAVLCVLFPIGLFWIVLSSENRSVQDVLLRSSVVYDWSRTPLSGSR